MGAHQGALDDAGVCVLTPLCAVSLVWVCVLSTRCRRQLIPRLALARSTDEAVRLNERWPKAHYRRGLALRALDSLPDAAAAFQRSLDLDPALKDVSANPQPSYRRCRDHPIAGPEAAYATGCPSETSLGLQIRPQGAVYDWTMNSDGAGRRRRRWRRWSA